MITETRSHGYRRRAFTILELLTVIAIIAMLVGLLAPGMQMVARQAKALKQKAEMHGMEVGLNMFQQDFDDFPDSFPVYGSQGVCPGAMQMTEALVGLDGRGFEPLTSWDQADPEARVRPRDPSIDLYVSDETTPEGRKSVHRRKGPYFELKQTSMYRINELYDSYSGDLYPDGVVLTDIFHQRRVTLPNGDSDWAGNPVVYFKADAASRDFRNPDQQPDEEKWIYTYEHNRDIFDAAPVEDPVNEKHRFASDYTDDESGKTGKQLFYEYLTNPTSGPMNMDIKSPFNPKTFILISAGYDGIFGTKDDISNFDY